MSDVVIGATYRHYKQRLYRVLNVALLEATRQPLVIYESLYPNEVARVWARPVPEFLEEVQTPGYTGPRFTLEPGT